MRPIVIDTGCLYRLKEDKEIFELISKQGFKHFDYSLFWKNVTEHIGIDSNYVEKAKSVKTLADSYGLKCTQTHASFLVGSTIEEVKDNINAIIKEIEITSILGSDSIVIHPILYGSLEENAKLFKTILCPVAKKFKVKILIENVWGVKDNKIVPISTSKPDTFKKLLSLINEDNVGVCLDIGHAEIQQLGTSAVEMIHTFKDKIWGLHIHDNDTYCDAHQIPYTHKISYSLILDALKEEKYKGNITFEVETCYNKGENPNAELPLELFPAFVKLQYEIGKYFAKYLDN